MNEPVLIVKVRKETKVTVPAGGYMLLLGPDKPFNQHFAERAKVLKGGQVNEDVEALIIGHVRNSHPVSKFNTAAQQKAEDDRRKKFDADLAASVKSSDESRKKAEDAAAAAEEKASKARLAELNEGNDAIRTRLSK